MVTIEFSKTRLLHADIDRVWMIMADDFTDVAHWVSSVETCVALESPGMEPAAHRVGRSCQVIGFGRTDERITHLDRQRHELTYSVEAEKMPGFVRDASTAWSMHSVEDDRTIVKATVTATATGLIGGLMTPLLTKKFKTTVDTLLDDLRAYAEAKTPTTTEASP